MNVLFQGGDEGSLPHLPFYSLQLIECTKNFLFHLFKKLFLKSYQVGIWSGCTLENCFSKTKFERSEHLRNSLVL